MVLVELRFGFLIIKSQLFYKMFRPRNTKYLKNQKGFLKTNVSNRNSRNQAFPLRGDFCLASQETGYLIDKHLEIAKKTLKNFLGKKGSIWVNFFPSKPITSKPVGVRIGKGKGAVSAWIVPLTAGSVVFELKNVLEVKARQALGLLKKKLPLKIRVVSRRFALK
jgi:large subunit ribosomal protein L16